MIGGALLLQAGPARASDAVRSQATVDSEWKETVEALWPRLAFFLSGFEQCLYGAESTEALAGCQPLARKAKSISDASSRPAAPPGLPGAPPRAGQDPRHLRGALRRAGELPPLRGQPGRAGPGRGHLPPGRGHLLRDEASAEMEKARPGTAPGADEPGAPRLAARGAP